MHYLTIVGLSENRENQSSLYAVFMLHALNVYDGVMKVTLVMKVLNIKIRKNADLVVKAIISHHIILLSFLQVL